MSSTSTTMGIPSQHWSVKRYAVAVALVLFLAVGAFGAYSLTRGEAASSAGSTAVSTEQVRDGGDGCSASLLVGGGLVESNTTDDRCGAPGRPLQRSGVQP